MDKFQSLNAFWNSFNIPAYDENSVPDDAVLPYLTYELGTDDFLYPVSLSVSLWDKNTRWDNISIKSEEIADRITSGGIMIPYDGGAMWLKKGRPFSRRMSDTDDTIRRIFMNIEIEFIN